MSARDERDCPFCADHLAARKSEAMRDLEDDYGRIPPEAYASQLARVNAMPTEPSGETLREWYEHWFDDGKFRARYNCSCEVCGFYFNAPDVCVPIESKR